MPSLKKIIAGVVAVAAVGGVAVTSLPEPTLQEIAIQDQITALELLIANRTAVGESTTMQV